MRLIDADVLKQGVNGVSTHWLNEWSTLGVLAMVDKQPTVDAVPVVRCKDCRYSRKPNRHDRDENAACESVLICCVGFDHVYPSAYDGLIFMDESDYCSNGVRKEQNDEIG